MIYRLHEHLSWNLNLNEKKNQIKIQKQALSVIQISLYFISWSYNAALKKNKNLRLGQYALVASYYDFRSITKQLKL